jgi:hypothetical protein
VFPVSGVVGTISDKKSFFHNFHKNWKKNVSSLECYKTFFYHATIFNNN